MTDSIRWGILGSGGIARKFADGLKVLPDAELVAVGSRTQAGADRFAAEYGIPHRHASYEALANDPDVDAIYVATPHPMHKDNALLCMDAGKAVLLEKPFTINAAEAEIVINRSWEKRVFLMEAMWTRFQPAIVRVRELLEEGAIGDVLMVQADFGFNGNFPPEHRLRNPDLGGGALLDVGIYPVSFASMVYRRQPDEISAFARMDEGTNVDDVTGMLFRYDGGQMAMLSCAIHLNTPQEALILGTKGRIRVHSPFWQADGFTLSISGQADEVISLPKQGNGYNYEAAEVNACLRAGYLESEVMPLAESMALMQTLDQIRAPWGLVYPSER